MAGRSVWTRGLIWMLGLLLLSSGSVVVGVWSWLNRPLALTGPAAELSIETGATPREVAQAWVDAGVQTQARFLYEWFRWSGKAKLIKAGSYEIDPGTSPRGLLAKMVQGDEQMERVRFIEGWTFKQLRATLAKAPKLKNTTAGLSDAQVMAALGLPDLPAEGRFFPDTYVYSRGVSDLTVLRRAHKALQQRLDQVWAEKPPESPLKTPADLLTLASIVEKETGLAADRGLVAGVFINRLRIGMPLQTDPTVIYGLGDRFDGNLRKRDLLADTPFNTYTRGGLPPTPIALPGMASLRASVRPQATKALYFVARGDGTSVFSDNLADHNRAVNKYQRGGS